MSIFKETFLLIFLFLFISYNGWCEEVRYKLINMGLSEMDKSHAIAINESGQVLGKCYIGGEEFLFIWNQVEGLKIIDKPQGILTNFQLNNKGAITGVSQNGNSYNIFLWDPFLGYSQIDNSTDEIFITGFNDNSQILGRIKNSIYVWSHDEKIDLSSLFRKKINGDWDDDLPIAINNQGYIAFSAYKKNVGQDQPSHVKKSFLWKNANFHMIMPEKNWDTCIDVCSIDDEENMIVNLYPRHGGSNKTYFINKRKNMTAYCEGCHLIKNGLPLAMNRRPGKLKKDSQGNLYFSPGIKIIFLLDLGLNSFDIDIKGEAEIESQNSKGQAAATLSTINSHQAFFVTPEE